MATKQRYIWHSDSGTLFREDECMVIELTEAEARLIQDGKEAPSEKLARVIREGVKR